MRAMALLGSSELFLGRMKTERMTTCKFHLFPQVRNPITKFRFITRSLSSSSSSSSWSLPPSHEPELLLATSDAILKSFSPSRFTPSPPAPDISNYLLNGCKWTDAPNCPDYIGPVSIGRTRYGRGLFARSNFDAGDIISISNAFALSHNDTHNIDLFDKIYTIVKESPLALRRYYCLAGNGPHDNLAVPDIRLFDANYTHFHGIDPSGSEELKIDEEKLVRILHVNAFSGEVSPTYNKTSSCEEGRINGLWLIPSFVNHSCCPNASRLIVGKAMFIVAARDIKAEEEINFSYTNIMSPLRHREKNLAEIGYGFRCECHRCETERSVEKEFEEVSQRYQDLLGRAEDEVYSAVTSPERQPPHCFPACVELFELYEILRGKVNALRHLTKVQKQWILSGYSCAFLGKWFISGYANGFNPPSDFISSNALELVEAMKCTEPGMLRTLSFMTILAHVAAKEEERRFSLVQSLVELALHECVCLYGKQRLDVTMELMEQSANIVPFF